jgi:hypothetical protein
MDSETVLTVLTLVAQISATEVVKEITKDSYKQFKDTLGGVFGRRAVRAITRLESDPTSAEARKELEASIAAPPPEDESELQAALSSLLAVLADDPAGKKAAAQANIRLDVEAGGHVSIERLDGASNIDVTSKSAGNFDFRDVRMESGRDSGN